MDDIGARVVVEGVNGPTTPKADKVLKDKGIFLVPDILANAGGVTVSYFEWIQGLQFYFWGEKEINLKLRDIMDKAFDNVYNISQERGINMRKAAYILAISRIAEATKIRGLCP